MSRRETIRKIVTELLMQSGDREELTDDATLLSSGRMQSIDVIEIVLRLEEGYAVDFSDYDFDPDDFDTIDAIVAMVDASAPQS